MSSALSSELHASAAHPSTLGVCGSPLLGYPHCTSARQMLASSVHWAGRCSLDISCKMAHGAQVSRCIGCCAGNRAGGASGQPAGGAGSALWPWRSAWCAITQTTMPDFFPGSFRLHERSVPSRVYGLGRKSSCKSNRAPPGDL